MNLILGLLLFGIYFFHGVNSIAGTACNGYEAMKINSWDHNLIQETKTIVVEVCCERDNNEVTQEYKSVRPLRLSLKHGDEIEIDNLKVDDKHPVTYTCSKKGDLNNTCKAFVSAYVNKRVSDITVRVYHQNTEQFSGYIDTSNKREFYYGFKVNKGTVKIAEYTSGSNKVCEAKVGEKRNKSKIRLNAKGPVDEKQHFAAGSPDDNPT